MKKKKSCLLYCCHASHPIKLQAATLGWVIINSCVNLLLFQSFHVFCLFSLGFCSKKRAKYLQNIFS